MRRTPGKAGKVPPATWLPTPTAEPRLADGELAGQRRELVDAMSERVMGLLVLQMKRAARMLWNIENGDTHVRFHRGAPELPVTEEAITDFGKASSAENYLQLASFLTSMRVRTYVTQLAFQNLRWLQKEVLPELGMQSSLILEDPARADKAVSWMKGIEAFLAISADKFEIELFEGMLSAANYLTFPGPAEVKNESLGAFAAFRSAVQFMNMFTTADDVREVALKYDPTSIEGLLNFVEYQLRGRLAEKDIRMVFGNIEGRDIKIPLHVAAKLMEIILQDFDHSLWMSKGERKMTVSTRVIGNSFQIIFDGLPFPSNLLVARFVVQKEEGGYLKVMSNPRSNKSFIMLDMDKWESPTSDATIVLSDGRTTDEALDAMREPSDAELAATELEFAAQSAGAATAVPNSVRAG